MSTLESGQQPLAESFPAPTFYQDPPGGMYAPWVPSTNYNPLRPEALSAPTRLLNGVPGLPHMRVIYPPLPVQQYPAISPIPSLNHSQPATQPPSTVHDHPTATARTTQKPVRTERNLRRTQRSSRPYNPTQVQRAGRPREGGRGRTRGSPNYKRREVETLLDLVEEELPIASKGWHVVGSRFRDWAFDSQNPARTDRSLELKFKQLVKTKKPTGDANCPPSILRAHEINGKIQSKVSCRDLEDGEIIEVDNDEGNASDDNMSYSDDHPEDTDVEDSPVNHTSVPRVRTKRVEAPLLSKESSRQSSFKGSNILEQISRTFNPEVQLRRDSDRASSMFQTQQLIVLQSQVRDLNTTILALRTRLDDSERRRTDAVRRADRLQNQIDITSAVTQTRGRRSTRAIRHPTPITISSSTPDHHHRYEAIFNDGGRSSWFGNHDRLNNDPDVVGVIQVPWSPPRSPTPSPPRSYSGYETEAEI